MQSPHAKLPCKAVSAACIIATPADVRARAGTHLPPELNSVRETMVKHRADAEEMMAQRLRKGIEDGDLTSDTDVPALAAFYSAVTRGMAVHARDGAGPQKLKAIADVATKAWPVQRRKESSARSRRVRIT